MFCAGNKIHRTTHARDHLSGDHPVCQKATLVDLKASEHGHVEMAAANEAETHGAVDGCGARYSRYEASAGIGQVGILHAFRRTRSKADNAIFRLKEDMNFLRQIVGDHRWQSDAEIYERVRFDLLSHAPCDDFLSFHRAASPEDDRPEYLAS